MRFTSFFQPSLIALAVVGIISQPVLAAESGNSSDTKKSEMEHLAIFGNAQAVNDIPGSAHMISKDELEIFSYTDIMRTLTSIPGVYVLEEDGYGLRPNIGMRGTGQNRSEKVTIMEDNVLAAPAAYSAPSAYYFPTAGRMQQVEVLKGTSSAMYGPRTTGGVLNMLSRQIPDEVIAGQVNVSAGEDGYGKLHAYAGGASETVSSVVEVFRYQADGFKDINYSDQNTGFVKNDFLAKLRINSDKSASYYQEVEFKLGYADEESNETYIGLTEADFNDDPYSRYSASQLDNMSTTHYQFQINHLIQLSDRFNIGTTAYYNEFSRNWYKASKINGDKLGSGGIEAAAAFDENTNGATLDVDIKANNRDYLSQGIQTTLSADFNAHQVKFGLRYHEDEMDRYQWVDKYQLDENYAMSLVSGGVPGTDSNRIDSAKALALFVHDEITFGNLVINAGLRYEDIVIERNDWGKKDPSRGSTPKYKKNSLDVLLPSLAVSYKLSDDLVLISGVQKGFAPPAPGNESSTAEESINYELGLRYSKNSLTAEALVFYSDYSNMHGNCSASQGCDDENIGDQYNAGNVDVSGLEFTAEHEFSLGTLALPVNLTYTYTESEFQNNFSSKLDTWGDVSVGDEMPYVPNNQLQLSVALVGEKWRSDMIFRYIGDMRTTAGQGTIDTDELIASHSVIDLVAHYNLTNQQKVSLSLDNLLDETYAASRAHGSIMVGKPRTFTLSYQYSF
jgi:Fe(3+) dicitrate transport protein